MYNVTKKKRCSVDLDLVASKSMVWYGWWPKEDALLL